MQIKQKGGFGVNNTQDVESFLEFLGLNVFIFAELRKSKIVEWLN